MITSQRADLNEALRRTAPAATVHVNGASGYAAGELIRLLAGHPSFVLGMVASGSGAGKRIGSVFPSLAPLDVAFTEPKEFFDGAGPGHVVILGGDANDAAQNVERALGRDARVIDLSAAFRLQDLGAYARWYGLSHTRPELVAQAAYGLPELHSATIARAKLVANPGCYPTASLLALAPIVRNFGHGISEIVVDAKSGVSGAGRKPATENLYAEVHESVRPYAVGGHRHVPEMVEQLRLLGYEREFVFLPHVVPMSRGMLATAYVSFRSSAPSVDAVAQAFQGAYAGRGLIDVLEPGNLPQTRAVAATVRAAIGFARVGDRMIVAASAIDNLGKGAAGQAVQNLNIMHGLPQDLGLHGLGAVA